MGKPKYVKIKQSILHAIEGQEPNTPIPGEREIALMFEASRMTVRKAIEELVEDGYLYREKNVGTFVTDARLHKTSSSVILEETHEEMEYKILYFDIKHEAEIDVLRSLEMRKDDNYLRIVRKAEKGDKTICIEEIFIARRNISDYELGNLNEFLDLNKMIKEGSTSQLFTPMLVPTQYAKLLHLKLGTPIIRIDNIVYKLNGYPFVYIKSYYNPNEKKIEIKT